MKIRRPFRAVVYVAVIVASVGYVLFSASQQPAFINATFVGEVTSELFGKARPTGQGSSLYYFHRHQGLWKNLEWTQVQSAQYVVCSLHSAPYRSGVWHQTYEVRGVRVLFYDPTTVTRFDTATRRDILIALESAHPGTVPAHSLNSYVTGGSTTSHILWLGVLGDLSILAAFAAIIFSLVKLRCEIKWRKPGHCTECDYNLAGLTADKCPECGAAVISASRNKGA